jgi:hypothetical protein
MFFCLLFIYFYVFLKTEQLTTLVQLWQAEAQRYQQFAQQWQQFQVVQVCLF